MSPGSGGGHGELAGSPDPDALYGAPETAALVAKLRDAGETLAVAESCTGGMLGQRVTSVPGASAVFWGGVISYDDAAKRRLLHVSADTLHEHGAVSGATAREMAAGVRRAFGSTWGVAITGIAGPTGGSPEKPVGTVWIAVDGPTGSLHEFRFAGDREAVRTASVEAAIGLLMRALDRAPGERTRIREER